MPDVITDDYRIQEILRHLEDDPLKTVQELGCLVNLSSSRLGHLFKTETGISLDSYLTEVRMEKAADLLVSTDMQIKEIAAIVGYRQVPSLDRAFRNRFGLSPADYRYRKRIELRE